MEEQPPPTATDLPSDDASDQADVAGQPKPIRDAMKLLVSVPALPFATHVAHRYHYRRFPIGWFPFFNAPLYFVFGSDRWGIVAYAILVIPLSIVRIRTFQGHQANPGLVIFVGLWFEFVGLVEVILFVSLRPDFGLHLTRRRH